MCPLVVKEGEYCIFDELTLKCVTPFKTSCTSKFQNKNACLKLTTDLSDKCEWDEINKECKSIAPSAFNLMTCEDTSPINKNMCVNVIT